MREEDEIREMLRDLSSPDLSLSLDGREVVIKSGDNSTRLPLKVIRGAGPDARAELSAAAFNLFVSAGSRLTFLLREAPLQAGAFATSTGLLRLRIDQLYVDVERRIEQIRNPQRGNTPKLQGISELVAEALLVGVRDEPLPPLEELEDICKGSLPDGPSIAQIQRVIARLEAEGILQADRKRGPRFTRYYGLRRLELLRLWAREYLPSASRSLALETYVTARNPEAVIATIQNWDLAGDWAVGGASAAQIWRPTLSRAPKAMVWVNEKAWDDATSRAVAVDEADSNLTIRLLAGRSSPRWYAHHVEQPIPVVSRPRAYVETVFENRKNSAPRIEELADSLLETLVDLQS